MGVQLWCSCDLHEVENWMRPALCPPHHFGGLDLHHRTQHSIHEAQAKNKTHRLNITLVPWPSEDWQLVSFHCGYDCCCCCSCEGNQGRLHYTCVLDCLLVVEHGVTHGFAPGRSSPDAVMRAGVAQTANPRPAPASPPGRPRFGGPEGRHTTPAAAEQLLHDGHAARHPLRSLATSRIRPGLSPERRGRPSVKRAAATPAASTNLELDAEEAREELLLSALRQRRNSSEPQA